MPRKPSPLVNRKKLLRKRKPRVGEGPFKAKKIVKGKSAEELYDSKRKSFRDTKKIESFKLGKAVRATKKAILRDDYAPKLKNEKEIYSSSLKFPKQDYSDVIKKAEKTKKRIQRNRKAAGTAGGVGAATVLVSNIKDKK